MKNDPRSLLRDIKAAIRLGRLEAVNIALDGLLAFPGVAANARMGAARIHKVILPIGGALSPLPARQLRPLLAHPLAAGRAVGAVALAKQFLSGGEATSKDLRKAARDPRPDVRAALAHALAQQHPATAEKRFALAAQWLEDPSPRVRGTALGFLPALADSRGPALAHLLEPLGADRDREVRAALADALIALGRAGLTESVEGLLARWETEPDPNSWVIRRVRERLTENGATD